MAKTLNVQNPCHDPKNLMSTFVLLIYINSYVLTNQILASYVEITISDNLTQALLFLSHFMGDVHQVCLTITITKRSPCWQPLDQDKDNLDFKQIFLYLI